MLTPREFDQLHVALFSMARTRLNGVAQIEYDHVMVLLRTYTEGNIEITKDGPDGLQISVNPTKETV